MKTFHKFFLWLASFFEGSEPDLAKMAREQNIEPVKTPAWADLRVPYDQLTPEEHVKRNEMLSNKEGKTALDEDKEEVGSVCGITESQQRILEQAQYELQLAEVREKTVESEMKAAEMVMRKRSVEGQDAKQTKEIADEKDTSDFPEGEEDPVSTPLGIGKDGKMSFQ